MAAADRYNHKPVGLIGNTTVAIDDAKLEIYKYVQQEYATLIDARQGQKTRLGQLLILTGFLITVSFTFGVPSLVESVKLSASLDRNSILGICAALLPLPVLVVLLWYLVGAVLAILSTLSHVRLNITGLSEQQILDALKAEHLDGNHVVLSLTRNHLRALKDNEDDNYTVATRFAVALKKVRRAAVISAVFVVLTLTARVVLYYGCNSTQEVEGNPMAAPNESSNNPAGPESTPAQPPVSTNPPGQVPPDPSKPNLDMKPITITNAPPDNGGTIRGTP